MTPAARIASSIDILGTILDGRPVEQTLLNWSRSNRYAGSKDRAAIRDIVFSCLRSLRSFQYQSGIEGAKGAVVGYLLSNQIEVGDIFSGLGYAPNPLSDQEIASVQSDKPPAPKSIANDMPDWLWPQVEHLNGSCFDALKDRAPIDLRVNLLKSTVQNAQDILKEDGLKTDVIPDCAAGLRVQGVTRKVPTSKAYLSGLVELQDAGSQQLIEFLPALDGHVLDYCAGGGGKSLALLSQQPNLRVSAFDINPQRLNDLTPRAERAGISIPILMNDPIEQGQKFDHVLIDVPCSGSGAWRRSPAGKWRLTQEELQDLQLVQAEILKKSAQLITADGSIIYMTCSVLDVENQNQVDTFLSENSNWVCQVSKTFDVSEKNDGFFCAILKKQ